jgi:hypothetical protein
MKLDSHTVALISITGNTIDVLGALYLAYDLLGGEHGPLRTLTRAVTYGALFGVGYGLGFGPVFGLACGVAHGITLAIEGSRASKGQPNPGFLHDTAMSAIRGAGFALGASYLYGGVFGASLGVFSTVGQALAYRAGIRPTMDYEPAARPRLTRHQLIAVVIRSVGYTAAGYGLALAEHLAGALSIGVKFGLVIGGVTAIVGGCMSFIEWSADHVPARRMGVLGVGFIITGFALQSVQYWLAL